MSGVSALPGIASEPRQIFPRRLAQVGPVAFGGERFVFFFFGGGLVFFKIVFLCVCFYLGFCFLLFVWFWLLKVTHSSCFARGSLRFQEEASGRWLCGDLVFEKSWGKKLGFGFLNGEGVSFKR